MATPLTYAKFIAALKGAGLKVVEVKTNGKPPSEHNRNAKGPFGPVHGVAIHHTVTKGSAKTVELCRTGDAELPGPLCHGVITKDGTVHIVGYGRANHAGLGDPRVFTAVKAESYMTRPPVPATNTMDGNYWMYGFECENLGDGKDPWPAVQLDAMRKAAAALCKAHGWTEKSVIGHKEWQVGKIDPKGFEMPDFRSGVRDILQGPKPTPAPPPAPTLKSLAARLDKVEKDVAALQKR